MNTMNPESFDLTTHGLTVTEVHHNLSPMRRMVLSEFSAPLKAAMKDYESLTEYRRVE